MKSGSYPYSVSGLCDKSEAFPKPIEIIFRERNRNGRVKLRTYMSDIPTSRSDTILVDETTGYEVVDPERSVIFVSDNKEGGCSNI